jgi:hypothetical protein
MCGITWCHRNTLFARFKELNFRCAQGSRYGSLL